MVAEEYTQHSEVMMSAASEVKTVAIKEVGLVYTGREIQHPISDLQLSDNASVIRVYREIVPSGTIIEQAVALFIDISGQVIGFAMAGYGSDHMCMIEPRVIVAEALHLTARGIIFIHNHPSGSVQPSGVDTNLVVALKNICRVAQMELHDALVVGNGTDYYSFRENGEI